MYQFNSGPMGHHHTPPESQMPPWRTHGQQPTFQAAESYAQHQTHPAQPPQYNMHASTSQAPALQQPSYPSAQPGQVPQYGNYAQGQQQSAPQFGDFFQVPQTPHQQYGYSPGLPAPVQPQYAAYAPNQLILQQYVTPAVHQQLQTPTRPPPQTSKSNESCYNCGALDHWAQSCPEPRRAVPAGQSNNNRPFKRQKTHSGVTSTYAPPQNQQHSNLQRGWTHPPPAQRSFSAHFGSHTLASTGASQQHPWSQHLSLQSFIPTPVAQKWPMHGIPTPEPSSTGSQIPSPATSTFNGNYASYAQQIQSNSGEPAMIRHDSVSSLQQTPSKSTSFSGDTSPAPSKVQPSSNRSDSLSDRVQRATDEKEEIEPWLEELQALDFPEDTVPPDAATHDPAKPAAQPLPSIMSDLDSTVDVTNALSSPEEASLSKYFRGLKEEDYLKNVQQSSDWTNIKDDPVFAKIKANTETITFEELTRRRAQLANPTECADDDASEKEQPDQPLETDDMRLAREQEERLAALGVTGVAKPVRAPAWRALTATSSTDGQHDMLSPSQSRCASLQHSPQDNNGHLPTPASDLLSPAEYDGYTKARRQTAPRASLNRTDSSFDHSPAHQHKYFDGPQSLQGSPTDIQNQPNNNGYLRSPSEAHWQQQHSPSSASPNKSKPEQYLSRKRSYRYSSEESEGRPKRQDAEQLQRNKYKHPQVAAAYSRRW